MKTRWLIRYGVAALLTTSATADKMEPPPPQPQADRAQMIQMVEKMSAPRAEHQVLADYVGEFTYTGKMTMGPGEPLALAGRSKGAFIIGGRFVEMNSASTNTDAPSVESKTILGYDTRKGKYTLWGVDSMGTYSVTAEGDYDAATRTLTLYGAEVDGDRKMRFRFVMRVESAEVNRMQIEFEMSPDTWTKVVEMVSTRRK